MPFNFGNNNISKIYKGTTEISTVYKGGTQVFSSGPLGFELGTLTYDNKSIGVGGSSLSFRDPEGITMDASGTNLYVFGGNRANSYTMSTPFDLSTASFTGANKSIGRSDTKNILISPDGLRLYQVGVGSFVESLMTTPFDWNTVYSNSFNFHPGDEYSQTTESIAVSPDGTKMYAVATADGAGKVYVYQYTLTVPYSLRDSDGVTFDGAKELTDVSALGGNVYRFQFNNSGTKFFNFVYNNYVITQWTCSTPYDVLTATPDGVTVNLDLSNDTLLKDIHFSVDGKKVYIFGDNSNRIYQYSNSGGVDL